LTARRAPESAPMMAAPSDTTMAINVTHALVVT
jgi:hypothetical protein